jgi:hypothetical protein
VSSLSVLSLGGLEPTFARQSAPGGMAQRPSADR